MMTLLREEQGGDDQWVRVGGGVRRTFRAGQGGILQRFVLLVVMGRGETITRRQEKALQPDVEMHTPFYP